MMVYAYSLSLMNSFNDFIMISIMLSIVLKHHNHSSESGILFYIVFDDFYVHVT